MDFENFCESYTKKSKTDKDFGTKICEKENVNNQSGSLLNEKDIKQKIDKYKNYNNQELLAELLAEANRQKKNGNLTDKNLQEMIANLSPYLDDSQKQKLNDIINLLR